MKQLRKFMVMAATVVAGALAPDRAYAQDIVRDLVIKGREAVNNFEYKAAETLAYQILAMQITRQQKIDALELLAAATYPDDATAQRADSAKAVIRQLVAEDVPGITTAELKWRGLDSLFTVVAASAATSLAAVQTGDAAARSSGFDSIQSIISLVASGRSRELILARVNIDCANMAFDQLETTLRRARAPAGLFDGLQRKCGKLLVETDPPNAVLTLNGANVGTVPERGHLSWVQPQQNAEIAVSLGGSRIPRTVTLPQGRLLQAKFFFPRDTLPLPPVRTASQIAEDLRLFQNFRPSTPRPAEPVLRRGMNAFTYGLIWGILGAGAGYAAGQFLPATGCTANHTVPPGEYWNVNGTRYSGGETVNLGEGMPCTMRIAGASGIGMWALTSLMKTGKNRGATRRYNEAIRVYPDVVKNWEETERRAFAERNADVRQAMADERVKLAQAQAENDAIRTRNAQLPDPQIFERELDFANAPTTPRAAPSTATPPTAVVSDVDIRVPSAAAPNPDAVAIVIGNREYRGRGIPNVDYATRDAASMKRYLVETFGFSEDRVVLDTNVTSGRMQELFGSANDASVSRLAELVKTRPAGSVDVFVFYSGHGAPSGRPAKKYLLPVDATANRIPATSYSLDQLYQNLTALNAKSVTVAIDAGFGRLASDMFSNESFGGGLEVEIGTVGGLNSLVMTAGRADQSARWRRDQGHGLFTYFLLRGLQGAADANSDNTITADELQTYVTANVRTYATERLSGAAQEPEVFSSNPNRPIVQLKSGM